MRRSSAARTPGFDPGAGGANPPAARILIPPLAHQQSARPIIARRPGRHRRGGPPCRWMAEKSCTGLKHRPVWSVTRSSGVPRFAGPWQTSGMRPPCKRDHVGANPTGSTIATTPLRRSSGGERRSLKPDVGGAIPPGAIFDQDLCRTTGVLDGHARLPTARGGRETRVVHDPMSP